MPFGRGQPVTANTVGEVATLRALQRLANLGGCGSPVRSVSREGGRRMIEPHECDLDCSGGAARIVLRRNFGWDRAGLFYFGRRYAGWTLTLTSSELVTLANGRQIVVAPGTEYLLLLRSGTSPS